MNRTRLNPMSARRRAELAAEGNLYPSSTLVVRKSPERKPAARKRPTDTGPDQATVDAALERDGHSCVVCLGALHGTRGVDYSLHHRKKRSQGGDNRLSNLISTCGHGTAGCHGDIHAGPNAARKGGWWVDRDQNPEQVPVMHALHGHVFLRNDGTWTSRRPTNDAEEATA